MESPLQVIGLQKRYLRNSGEEFEAVAGISFEVRRGECFGLLGPNGAGKSTTIQCVCGFYPATSGKIILNGYDVAIHPRQARALLGVCSQEETLDSDFNVIDQLVLHASYFRVPKREAAERAAMLLGAFGLADRAREQVESLSGGLKRRLQVARALISNPEMLVLDEPTVGLDPQMRRMLWDILLEQRKKGVAILLCTHYMDEAQRLCDRIAILCRGKILDIDTPENLISRHVPHAAIEEEVRPGVFWKRAPNLEDVYLHLTGSSLDGAAQ